MDNFAEWMFQEFWRYTVLTFRLFYWLFRFLAVQVSRLLNNRQKHIHQGSDDLFESYARTQEEDHHDRQ